MITKLKHIANLSGTTVKEFQGEKKYYSTGDINTEKFELVTFKNRPSRANLLVNENDILIAKMKNTNKTTIATKEMEEYIFSTGFSILSSKNINTKYLYYLLESPEFIEKKDVFSVGTTQVSINDEALKNIEINYIEDTDIQNRIAIFLDKKVLEIDNIIEKTQMTIEDYKKYKQSIITKAVTGGINKDIKFKDSGFKWISQIPENWMISKMKYFSDEIGDGLHSTPEYDNNGEFYFINGNNIGDEFLTIKKETNRLNLVEYSKYKQPLLNNFTIMISLNGATYGKISLYNKEKVLLGKSAGYITYKNNVNRKFMKYYLSSYLAKELMTYSLNGTTIQNLSLDTLRNFMCFIPSIEDQENIAKYLDEKCIDIDHLISSKEKIIEELEQYKKSLIYEYVTGKKEVI